ncbi:MAG: hypothetical protein GX369_00345 [Euryarchaeota archaeon]|nr:hypothetical protein [Euryarchaeota archaeon]
MNQINVVMCSGFSPSSRMIRKALRRIAEKVDIRVISVCPSSANLAKHVEEITELNPTRTLVIEGCDGCCGSINLMMRGVIASKTTIMEKVSIVDESAINRAEESIMAALEEMNL